MTEKRCNEILAAWHWLDDNNFGIPLTGSLLICLWMLMVTVVNSCLIFFWLRKRGKDSKDLRFSCADFIKVLIRQLAQDHIDRHAECAHANLHTASNSQTPLHALIEATQSSLPSSHISSTASFIKRRVIMKKHISICLRSVALQS